MYRENAKEIFGIKMEEVYMQAIILAAGMGRRMGKYTENHTKCMMIVGKRTLLERTIEALQLAGINRLIMVIGYEAENLRSYIEKKKFNIEIKYVYNYDYSTTNNIYSLFLARDYMRKDDTILIESDLIFDSNLIKDVKEAPQPNLAVVAKYEQWMDGTMVVLNAKREIIDFIDKTRFRYEDVGTYYKTVNIYKFSKEFSESQYIPFMEAYLKAYGMNQYYEQVLKIFSHIRNSELSAYVIDDENWYEIDDAQDLDIANTIFAQDEDILKKYELHYGGYWRFPKLKDFCYLVNPYYPPPKMISQLKYFFEELLTQYPSGMNIQKLNAASMFGVDEEYLLVGNGAAELINVLGKIVQGRLSVCIPAFNEYIRCFVNCESHIIDSSKNDYQYNIEQLLEEVEHTDNLLIVNPDNPSGAFLTYDEIMQIVEKCHQNHVLLIIDESFIDFAEKNVRYTLINDRVLEKYEELIIIKSISKSYGVPGLRLGIMATANRVILKQMKDNLAIWNINSFAEYYLQIQRLYKKSYMLACDKIAVQRKKMIQKISEIKGMTAYPSQANYIMCSLDETVSMNSAQLSLILLKKYNLLIKNLSAKKGFNGKSYLRFAIRSEEDNCRLIDALREELGEK